jgi:hypothetical protein
MIKPHKAHRNEWDEGQAEVTETQRGGCKYYLSIGGMRGMDKP